MKPEIIIVYKGKAYEIVLGDNKGCSSCDLSRECTDLRSEFPGINCASLQNLLRNTAKDLMRFKEIAI